MKHIHGAPVGVEGYVLYRCKCQDCISAYNALGDNPRERRLASPVKPVDVHGTWNGYSNHGCRCDKCMQACKDRYARNAAYRREHRMQLQAKQRERRRAKRQEELDRKNGI